ncbi:WYL domain-containing protein [Clostridium sediminicola]|uniref:WYL domain-containing protein n=1 Tax=Clostridium sediminicola TaxID=3114879 RepID=UPI0031F1F628
MELFSEIYSCYYNAVSKILNRSIHNPISKETIWNIIEENAFSESTLHVLPKLINGEWDLLQESNKKYLSKLNAPVKLPLTLLEKSWLKTILQDKRILLFLNEEEIMYLIKSLNPIDLLFDINDFCNFDNYSDGDNYNDENYINIFRKVLAAFKNKTPIKITFNSRKQNLITGNFIPYKFEYSSKDDKFRIHAIKIKNGEIRELITINLGRILQADSSNETFYGQLNLHKYNKETQCNEPVVIEISKERNAVERCMLHFANYEKRTEYHEETDKYISYIYYKKQDETELLIRILSFGPVIKVLGPQSFLSLIKERVMKQDYLLQSNK